MVYSIWLAGLGLLFLLLERIWPRRPLPILRKGIWSDLAYIVFNAEYLGMILALAAAHVVSVFRLDRFRVGLMADAGFWTQFFVLLFVFDFLQWCVHNLLHRVSWLWEFHKPHHSIVDLDWIGNWRFHWAEIIVYRALLYIPAALFGFSGEAMFWTGVAATFAGHFAHANLRWHIGPLKYVINSPEMHIWHHNHPECGPINRNFAITFAIWDWIFGTAWLPPRDPARLGFEGIERYPDQLPGQWAAPFMALWRWRG